MAIATKTIKRRIRSVKNTAKITKAMELVAASKMRKALVAVLDTRPYAKLAWNTVLKISRTTDVSLHPLLQQHSDATKQLIVLITSDRGLAGGFNTNMVKRVKRELLEQANGAQIEMICIGKKGGAAMARAGIHVIAQYTDKTNNPTFEDILPIGKMLIDAYVSGQYRSVVLAYTDFVSAISQQPYILPLLPLTKPEDVAELGKIHTSMEIEKRIKAKDTLEYLFEPSPQAVLDRMLPRLVETMMFQAVLESTASEHSARMLAMRNATDAAKEMIDALTLSFNQARQAGITQEIAEISSGAAALSDA